MSEIRHDYLYPVGTENRDEIFLCELDGFVLPSTEILLQNIRLGSDTIQTIFPHYHIFDDVRLDDFYYSCSLLSDRAFLRMLSDVELDDATCDDLAIDLHADPIGLQCIHETVFTKALQGLLEQDFMRKLYLISHRKLQLFEITYLEHLFQRNLKKVEFIRGSTLAFMRDHPAVTTVCLNRGEDAVEMLERPDEHHMDATMVLLRVTNDNMIYQLGEDGESTSTVSTKFGDALTKLTEGKTYKVSNIPVDCVPFFDGSVELSEEG